MDGHKLEGGAVVNEGNGKGITARCTCGWVSGGHFSSLAASAMFQAHQEAAKPGGELNRHGLGR